MNNRGPTVQRQRAEHLLRAATRSILVAAFVWMLVPTVSFAVEVQRITETLEEVRSRSNVCALGALVIENGRCSAIGVTGTVARGSEQPVSAAAHWHLGSCTKSMTATLAALMIQKGMFSWDLTVGEAFADESFEVHPDYQAVTLVELLSHRAGVPSDLIASPLWQKMWVDSQGKAEDQRKTITAAYVPRGPGHPPRSKFQYSNVGYVIAGRMLEKQGGKNFEELLVEFVFKPLDMNSAGFGPPAGADDPRGHRFGMPLPPGPFADNPPGLSSAGRVHMTLEDWGKYAIEHLHAARGESTKLLTPASAKRLHTPLGSGNYALGWGVPSIEWLDPPVLAHAGSNTMWRAEIWIVPTRNVAILVAVNEGTEAATKASRDVLRMLGDRYAPTADVVAARKAGLVPMNALKEGFTLKVRDESGKASESSALFVASNQNDWNPGDPESKMRFQDGVWILKLPKSPGQERMKFKITRGSWDTVEVDAALRDVSNRRVGFAAPGTSDAVMEITIPAFADQRDD